MAWEGGVRSKVVWSVERDSYFPGMYFIWSGTMSEPLQHMHDCTFTLLGARFWIWRKRRHGYKKPTPRSRIVLQVAA